MKIGKVIQELMESKEIKTNELAKALNITPSALSNYVHDIRSPDYEILKSIACYFNVSTDYLLNMQNDYTNNHFEDNLLRIFRQLSIENQELLIEQAELLLKHTKKEKTLTSQIAKDKIG